MSGECKMAEQITNKDFIMGFVGLSGSGKSTLAEGICDFLRKRGRSCFHIDGDRLRHDLGDMFGYTYDERMKNNRVVRVLGKYLCDSHIATMVSIIAPYEEMRQKMREFWGKRYIEVFVDCPLEICAARDVKGHYARAKSGVLHNLNGVNDIFERPENSELILHTDEETKAESLGKIIDYLEAHQYV